MKIVLGIVVFSHVRLSVRLSDMLFSWASCVMLLTYRSHHVMLLITFTFHIVDLTFTSRNAVEFTFRSRDAVKFTFASCVAIGGGNCFVTQCVLVDQHRHKSASCQ